MQAGVSRLELCLHSCSMLFLYDTLCASIMHRLLSSCLFGRFLHRLGGAWETANKNCFRCCASRERNNNVTQLGASVNKRLFSSLRLSWQRSENSRFSVASQLEAFRNRLSPSLFVEAAKTTIFRWLRSSKPSEIGCLRRCAFCGSGTKTTIFRWLRSSKPSEIGCLRRCAFCGSGEDNHFSVASQLEAFRNRLSPSLRLLWKRDEDNHFSLASQLEAFRNRLSPSLRLLWKRNEDNHFSVASQLEAFRNRLSPSLRLLWKRNEDNHFSLASQLEAFRNRLSPSLRLFVEAAKTTIFRWLRSSKPSEIGCLRRCAFCGSGTKTTIFRWLRNSKPSEIGCLRRGAFCGSGTKTTIFRWLRSSKPSEIGCLRRCAFCGSGEDNHFSLASQLEAFRNRLSPSLRLLWKRNEDNHFSLASQLEAFRNRLSPSLRLLAEHFSVASQLEAFRNRLSPSLRLLWKRNEDNHFSVASQLEAFRNRLSRAPSVEAGRRQPFFGGFAARSLQKSVVSVAAPFVEAERRQPFFGGFAARSLQKSVVSVAAPFVEAERRQPFFGGFAARSLQKSVVSVAAPICGSGTKTTIFRWLRSSKPSEIGCLHCCAFVEAERRRPFFGEVSRPEKRWKLDAGQPVVPTAPARRKLTRRSAHVPSGSSDACARRHPAQLRLTPGGSRHLRQRFPLRLGQFLLQPTPLPYYTPYTV